jgi:hypothetical protein
VEDRPPPVEPSGYLARFAPDFRKSRGRSPPAAISLLARHVWPPFQATGRVKQNLMRVNPEMGRRIFLPGSARFAKAGWRHAAVAVWQFCGFAMWSSGSIKPGGG